MAKKVWAIVLGFVLAPAFIVAENGIVGQQLVDLPCLIRIYHTNFKFPPQGGRIVTIGNEMYFWRDYLSGCGGADAIPPTTQPVQVGARVTVNSSAQTNPVLNKNFVADSCYVRVYHTNFKFPPQGGKIIQIGSEMYFVKDYLPGCENAASAGFVKVAGTNSMPAIPLQNTVVPAATLANTQPTICR